MEKKIVGLIANGSPPSLGWLAEKVNDCDFLIAVDGGLNHCFAANVAPDLILGDFDSLDSQLLDRFSESQQKRFPIAKDESDLELAIAEALRCNPEKIYLLAATGGRCDHFLANVLLLSCHPKILELITPDERLLALEPGIHVFDCKKKSRISLIPSCGPVEVASTTGLRWPLHDALLSPQFMSLSNEVTETLISIEIRKGTLTLSLPSS